MAKLTVLGMYNYDNTLFDGLVFPDGIDKTIAVNEILTRSGEFETIYPALDFLKFQIENWGKKHYRTFEKWIDALNIEFEPLYNYDRYEEYTDAHSGSARQNETSNDIESAENKIDRSGNENIIEQSSKESTQSGDRTSNENSISNSDSESSKENSTSGNIIRSEDSTKSNSGSNSETETSLSSTDGSEHTDHSGSGFSASSTDTLNDNDVTVDRNVAAYDSSTLQPKEQEVTNGTTTSSGNGISNTSNNEETDKTSGENTSSVNNKTGEASGSESATSNAAENNNSESSESVTSTGNTATNTSTSESTSGSSGEDINSAINRANSQNESNINNLSRQNERSAEHSSDDITKHNAHLYGNIGVTTSTQMLEDYLRVERWNIYEQIANIFVDDFCIMVY